MRNFCIFADAVNYIEDNLTEPITQEDIAAACCCSLSALQKVWRFCSHTSLKEYISKRRLTRCAEEILHTDAAFIDIAMRYGYNSPEVFTRAFRRLWGASPSEFRTTWHSAGIFPRIVPDESKLEGGIYMGRRVDISELYEELRSKQDGYVLCCDVVGLMPINENLGRKAGDAVIREAFRRIDEAAGETMTAFRIGGDEFALVTGSADKAEVTALADSILSRNGTEIECDGKRIPVSVRIGAIKMGQGCLRYSDLFNRLQQTINNTLSQECLFISEE